jgi:hypothetical protein
LINRPKLGDACVEEADVYRENSIDILLRRVKPYNPNGRNQTEDEAKEIDKTLKEMLNNQMVPHLTFDGDQHGYDLICNCILHRLEKHK